ncbi:ORF-120 peptide [Chrysodeixis chalcites nucleopolyhedrovirus]|uniref:ORF-120 peptide n=1 Tax=Chrysodeixis chalcites nucleopolyhedrovirus TaxID=320432 RepID=Q4KSW0_9ABAC|nr:ORF-120 peptide [Chrysodeixis chalcites nucleopolyhedrovirus]AAY84051.1 ORF-120 peptide [Chrysodeixis chalcites nucleopolyhedrovirus]AGC36334.1 hypothetical protein TF1A_00120 [Chrysodeixis chalcites SNPV TF1-A]AGE61526.1 hypothetical protein [Chrysodeixis chalcites nucleopolyhedrovirus]AGE61680.1 hypothetical protein [Chrysodeixis chalcites nucleopolyhedrovirus]
MTINQLISSMTTYYDIINIYRFTWYINRVRSSVSHIYSNLRRHSHHTSLRK